MYLRIDPTQALPIAQVCEPDDFTGFKVVIEVPEHVWIGPEMLTDLAGRGHDDGWKQNLAEMLEFGASRGWLDEARRIRAHVEVQSSARMDR